MENKNLRVMLEISLMVAAALVLSLWKIFRMPQGGSVSLEMLPIFILAFRRGAKIGVLGGGLFGVLRLFLSAYVIHPIQFLLDYPVPFAVLGLAGLAIFQNRRFLGIVFASFLRYLVHVTGGVVFFAQYAPEGTPALLYALTYNAPFMIGQVVLCGVVIYILGKRREIFEPGQA